MGGRGGVDLLSSLSILPSVHPLTRFRSEPLAILDEFAAWQTGTRLPGGVALTPDARDPLKLKTHTTHTHTCDRDREEASCSGWDVATVFNIHSELLDSPSPPCGVLRKGDLMILTHHESSSPPKPGAQTHAATEREAGKKTNRRNRLPSICLHIQKKK